MYRQTATLSSRSKLSPLLSNPATYSSDCAGCSYSILSNDAMWNSDKDPISAPPTVTSTKYSRHVSPQVSSHYLSITRGMRSRSCGFEHLTADHRGRMAFATHPDKRVLAKSRRFRPRANALQRQAQADCLLLDAIMRVDHPDFLPLFHPVGRQLLTAISYRGFGEDHSTTAIRNLHRLLSHSSDCLSVGQTAAQWRRKNLCLIQPLLLRQECARTRTLRCQKF